GSARPAFGGLRVAASTPLMEFAPRECIARRSGCLGSSRSARPAFGGLRLAASTPLMEFAPRDHARFAAEPPPLHSSLTLFGLFALVAHALSRQASLASRLGRTHVALLLVGLGDERRER